MRELEGTIIEIRYVDTGVLVVAESVRDQLPQYFVAECEPEKFRAMAVIEGPLIGRRIVYKRNAVGEQTMLFLSRRPCAICAGEVPECKDETCGPRCANEYERRTVRRVGMRSI